MVDRLEELLALMENEDEDERESQEEVSALKDPAVPAPEARAGAPGERDAEETGKADGENGSGQPDELTRAVENGPVAAEAVRRRMLADELEDAVEALREAEISSAEAAAERGSAETERELGAAVKHEAESGLEGLYRRAAQAARPAAPQAAAVEQAGRTFRAEEPGRTAALTVDELDRAVRRDSRRYDGGMSIF